MDALVEKGRNHCNGMTSPSPRIIPLASYITDASRTLPTVEKVEDRLEGAVVGQLGTFDCPLILWMAIEGGRECNGCGQCRQGKRRVKHNANPVLQYHLCRADQTKAAADERRRGRS